jgi:hypothetical protein
MNSQKNLKFFADYENIKNKNEDGTLTDGEFVNELIALATAYTVKPKVYKLKEHIVNPKKKQTEKKEDDDEPEPFMVVFD